MYAGADQVTPISPLPADNTGALGAPGAAAGMTEVVATLPQPAPVSASTAMSYVSPLTRPVIVQVSAGASTLHAADPGVATAR